MLDPREWTEEQRRFKEKIASLRATPEERARIMAARPPFDYDAWLREAAPPSPEVLEEMDELLQERREERMRSLAIEEERRAERIR